MKTSILIYLFVIMGNCTFFCFGQNGSRDTTIRFEIINLPKKCGFPFKELKKQLSSLHTETEVEKLLNNDPKLRHCPIQIRIVKSDTAYVWHWASPQFPVKDKYEIKTYALALDPVIPKIETMKDCDFGNKCVCLITFDNQLNEILTFYKYGEINDVFQSFPGSPVKVNNIILSEDKKGCETSKKEVVFYFKTNWGKPGQVKILLSGCKNNVVLLSPDVVKMDNVPE